MASNAAVVYGPGTNHLPMIQVEDLAGYIAAAASPAGLAGLADSQQYLLATDCSAPGVPGTVTQGTLVKSLAARLGTGQVT